jgi:hypothetical protein
MTMTQTVSLVLATTLLACGDPDRMVPGADGTAQQVPDGGVAPDGKAEKKLIKNDKNGCPSELIPDTACSAPADQVCVNLGSTCGTGWGGFGLFKCTCVDNTWDCTGVDDADCASGLVPEGTSCYVEGTGTCDDPPAGGGCSCTNGAWSCFSSCPDWCPDYAPDDGEALSCPAANEGEQCRYFYKTCTCINGVLQCA